MDAIKQRWADRTYRPVHRAWPHKPRRGTAWLMGVELAGLIPMLVIFGLAQPDLYRSAMWQIGYDHRLNSNPNIVLYAYANHRPLPTIAFVWTQTLTDFNVAISVISLFFLLVKLILFIMRGWLPLVALLANISLVALYAASTYGQIGPDYADSRYPAPAAWYFRYGCDMARPYNMYRPCQIAQASLFVTLYMLVVYLINLGFAIWAMWPNKELNDVDEEEEDDSLAGQESKPWEMQSIKSSVQESATPFTPRTQAFRALDRQVPPKATKAPSYR